MDKNSLKKVIKPLIKECLREVLMEEGLVKVIKEYNVPEQPRQVLKKETPQRKIPQQTQIKESVSLNGFNIFEGTKPAPKDGEYIEEDGVNIDRLVNKNQNSWFQHLGKPQE